MLKEVQILEDSTYLLEVVLGGNEFQELLNKYLDYVPKEYRASYENEYFPEGQTPIELNEEISGDNVYRYILLANFQELYRNSIIETNLNNVKLQRVELVSCSKENIILNVVVKQVCSYETGNQATIQDRKQNDEEILRVLKESLDKTFTDKLTFNTTVDRDENFWKSIQNVCISVVPRIFEETIPLFRQLGLAPRGRANSKFDEILDPTREILYSFVKFEIELFVYATVVAALYRYINNFTELDRSNVENYISQCVYRRTSEKCAFGGDREKILKHRMAEYSEVCEKGYHYGFQFSAPSENKASFFDRERHSFPERCSAIFCDHIAYIKRFSRHATYFELNRLLLEEKKSSLSEMVMWLRLNELFTKYAKVLFSFVRGEVNGGRIIRDRAKVLSWKNKGVCQHCGNDFKKTLFGLKCSNCGTKKDYEDVRSEKIDEILMGFIEKKSQDYSECIRAKVLENHHPERSDYGINSKNPVCSGNYDETEEYLSKLRTKDGESFEWKLKEIKHYELETTTDVVETVYSLYLNGGFYGDLYMVTDVMKPVCPPAGLFITD